MTLSVNNYEEVCPDYFSASTGLPAAHLYISRQCHIPVQAGYWCRQSGFYLLQQLLLVVPDKAAHISKTRPCGMWSVHGGKLQACKACASHVAVCQVNNLNNSNRKSGIYAMQLPMGVSNDAHTPIACQARCMRLVNKACRHCKWCLLCERHKV